MKLTFSLRPKDKAEALPPPWQLVLFCAPQSPLCFVDHHQAQSFFSRLIAVNATSTLLGESTLLGLPHNPEQKAPRNLAVFLN